MINLWQLHFLRQFCSVWIRRFMSSPSQATMRCAGVRRLVMARWPGVYVKMVEMWCAPRRWRTPQKNHSFLLQRGQSSGNFSHLEGMVQNGWGWVFFHGWLASADLVLGWKVKDTHTCGWGMKYPTVPLVDHSLLVLVLPPVIVDSVDTAIGSANTIITIIHHRRGLGWHNHWVGVDRMLSHNVIYIYM